MMEECIWLVLLLSASVCGDDYKVESISETQYKWAHSPFWDASTQTLYFADIKGGSVSSYKPSSKNLYTARIVRGKNASASMIIPIEGKKDKFVVGVNNTVANLTWDSMSNSAGQPQLIAVLNKNASIHTHTGKADPKGRLWIGTLGPFQKNSAGKVQPDYKAGDEYMLTTTGKVVVKIPKVSIPDGLAWNSDKTKFYFVDCFERKVEVYDYDNDSGNISNNKTIFDAKANNIEGYPAGMVIDTEGKLWVAVFFNGTVIRIDPDSGKLLRTIQLPAKELTSVAFGGKNLDTLYATSAQIFQNLSQPTKYSGRVFAVTGLMSSGKPVTGYPGQNILAI